MKLEPSLPKEFMQRLYEKCPTSLLSMFKLAMAIPNDKHGRPIKISSYFPKNYLGLEHTAHLRYQFFGRRLHRLAQVLVQESHAWFDEAAASEYVHNFNWDRVGISRLQPQVNDIGDEIPGKWLIVHPCGFQLVVGKSSGLGGAGWLTQVGS